MSDATPMSASQFDDADEALDEAIAHETMGEGLSLRQQFWQRVLTSRNLAITLVGVILFVFFSLATPQFLREFNLFNTIRNVALIGIVSVGMSCLMVAGEIDLSVGSTYGFLTVMIGILVGRNNLDPWLGMLIVIALGAVIGMVNGLIRTRLGIPSFIVTLAMLSVYRSLALIVSNEQPSVTRGEGFFYDVIGGNLTFTLPGVNTEVNMPWLIPWMVVIMFIGGVILSKTLFGYHIYATGGNLEAARNSGISTNRVKLACFMITSALCGLVAALVWGYLHQAGPTTGVGFEFRVIGAVVVGGVTLTGGRGTIYGSFMGAIIIGMITSGLVLLGFSQDIGDVAAGALIIAIGTLDLLVRRAGSRSIGMLSNAG